MIGIFSVVLISRLAKPSEEIIQRLKPLLYKDCISKMLSCLPRSHLPLNILLRLCFNGSPPTRPDRLLA